MDSESIGAHHHGSSRNSRVASSLPWWVKALLVVVLGGPLSFAYYAEMLTTPLRDQQLHDHGRAVESTVVTILGAPRELHKAHRAQVRFPLPNGSASDAVLDIGSDLRAGDHVTVVYNPAHPSVAVLPFQAEGSAFSRFLGPMAGFVFVLLIAAFTARLLRPPASEAS